MAWDIVLVLLWLGDLEHIALPHAGGHHHLETDSPLSPLGLEASLQGPPSHLQGDATPTGDQGIQGGSSPKVGSEALKGKGFPSLLQ